MTKTVFVAVASITGENPPFITLTQSRETALDALLNYCLHRFFDAYADELIDQASNDNDNEDFSKKSDPAEAAFSELLSANGAEWMLNWLEDWEGKDFEFSITEQAATTFVESALSADLIEIEDQSIRHFFVEKAPSALKRDETFLEASVITDDYNKVDFNFSYESALGAIWDAKRKCWFVDGSISVNFFQFAK